MISITHFLEFGGVWGLYSRVRDLPHTIRPEIDVVETFIITFYSIFVSGVLRVITQRYVRAESSQLDLIDSDDFYRSPTVCDP